MLLTMHNITKYVHKNNRTSQVRSLTMQYTVNCHPLKPQLFFCPSGAVETAPRDEKRQTGRCR